MKINKLNIIYEIILSINYLIYEKVHMFWYYNKKKFISLSNSNR